LGSHSQAKRLPAAGLVLDGTRRAPCSLALVPLSWRCPAASVTPMLCLLAALVLRCPRGFFLFLSSVIERKKEIAAGRCSLCLPFSSSVFFVRSLLLASCSCFFNGVFIEYGWRCSVPFGGNCNPGKGVRDG